MSRRGRGRLGPLRALLGGAGITLVAGTAGLAAQIPRFEVTIDSAAHPGPLTGRLVLVVARRREPEPRFTISPSGPALFAVDLEQVPAGRAIQIDTAALGFPRPLAELPPGDYFVQAVVNLYGLARRADGRRIWVHLNDGTQEPFQVAAGNLYSDVLPLGVGDTGGVTRIAVTHRIPAAERPRDTEWVRAGAHPEREAQRVLGPTRDRS